MSGSHTPHRRGVIVGGAALLARRVRHASRNAGVGLRCERHHLTQSVAVCDDRIVWVTPTSFSATPNRVKSGPPDLGNVLGRAG